MGGRGWRNQKNIQLNLIYIIIVFNHINTIYCITVTIFIFFMENIGCDLNHYNQISSNQVISMPIPLILLSIDSFLSYTIDPLQLHNLNYIAAPAAMLVYNLNQLNGMAE